MRESVKERLKSNQLSNKWLIHQLSIWGVKTDPTELSSGLSGRRKGAKIEKIVKTSDEILQFYETQMRGK